MPSFAIPLTGLQANSVALNTIGNNLANLNTTAYKSQTASFSTLFYQNLGTTGSGNALQQGLGTQVAGTSTDFTGGSTIGTTTATDMALNGSGYFVINTGGIQQLTRAGNFQLDQSGNLITTGGSNVMGYAAANGLVNTNTPLTGLQIPVSATQAAQATGTFGIAANLNAATLAGATPFSTTITMYDSLGTSHAATVSFNKTAPNTWNYTVTLPTADYTPSAVPQSPSANSSGTLTFDSTGAMTAASAKNVTGITFGGMTDGAADMSFTWDILNAAGVAQIGQTVGTSTVNTSTQDGFASGSYNGFSVDSAGILSASFSNGQTSVVGQIAVASVTNSEGLTLAGGNNYQATAASGAAAVGAPGSGGRGAIKDDALEASNVDISTQFANLIVAQRAFEANSKTVTTFDQVTQQTIAMIR